MIVIFLFLPLDLVIFVSSAYLISLRNHVLFLRDPWDVLVPKTKRKNKRKFVGSAQFYI